MSERKMANEGRPSGMEDRRPQTQVLRWQDLFSAALDLLQECEREWNSAEVRVRANIQIRLEYIIVARQQVPSRVSRAKAAITLTDSIPLNSVT